MTTIKTLTFLALSLRKRRKRTSTFLAPLRKRTPTFLALSLIITACQPADDKNGKTEVEHFNLPGIEDSGLPFSSAVRAGDVLYLSGVIGRIPGTLEVPDTIEEEARLAMDEIKSTVEAFGSSMDHVVKCTVFMSDEFYRDAFNAIYMSYFDKLPARSGVTVKGLALGAKAEVECIAIVG